MRGTKKNKEKKELGRAGKENWVAGFGASGKKIAIALHKAPK